MPVSSAQRKVSGFTLVELMVVMVIIGITLGLASLNAIPSPRQDLQKEAQRIALLLQLARDEAIVRNQLVTFEANADRYHFLVRTEKGWTPVVNDDLLRERDFKNAPVQFVLEPTGIGGTTPLRITFGREPVDKPFLLTLASGDNRVGIRADGVGHFTVEQ
jgi:general secretion pathway protein H